MSREARRLETWYKAGEDYQPPVQGCSVCCTVCCWQGSYDSTGCPLASPDEVFEILVHSIRVLGAYARDLDELEELIREHEPKFDKRTVVKFDRPSAEDGHCPPYFICVDDERREVAMYLRGLNLLHKSDYISLMNNHKGEEHFKGGYLHQGMFRSANWCIENVARVLKEELLKHEGYRLSIVGHSLGAGVASIFTALLLEDPGAIGGILPELIRAYPIAPPRVMSLDLAIKYAPNIHSVIYQDDFLPRISTSSVKNAFMATVALTTVVLFFYWLKQSWKQKSPDDVYRLYPPGQINHVVYKQPGVHHYLPIQVRVVESAKRRFENIIFSSSGTATDHSVLKMAKHLKTYDWPKELQERVDSMTGQRSSEKT